MPGNQNENQIDRVYGKRLEKNQQAIYCHLPSEESGHSFKFIVAHWHYICFEIIFY
jgi:hypothetical protein